MRLKDSLNIAGGVIYALVLLWTFVLFFLWRRNTSKKKNTLDLILIGFLSLFAAIRVAWQVVELTSGPSQYYAKFLLNRMAYLYFFSAFTIMILKWAQGVYLIVKMKSHPNNLTRRLAWPFIALNAALYGYQIAVFVIAAESRDRFINQVIYDTNLAILGAAFFFLSLLFLILGSFFVWRQWDAHKTLASTSTPLISQNQGISRQKRTMYKILAATLILVVAFFMRTFLFARRIFPDPLWFSFEVYFFLGYIIPEITPTVFQLFLETQSLLYQK